MNDQNPLLLCASIALVRGEDMQSLLIKKGDRELLLEFHSLEDTDFVLAVLDRSKSPLSLVELLSSIPMEKRQDMQKMIDQLIQLHVLIKIDDIELSKLVLNRDFEQALDNYFWENDVTWTDYLKQKSKLNVQIIGHNKMGLLVAELLTRAGIENIELIDYPYLKNKQYVNNACAELKVHSFESFSHANPGKNGSLVIVADEFGNIPALLSLNRFLLSKKIPYLPLFILSQIGYVGPFIVPGKTSCFECVLLRMEGSSGKLNLLEATEKECFSWQEQSSTHPSVIAALGHFFSFHLSTNLGYFMKSISSKTSSSGIDEKAYDLLQSFCNSVIELDLLTPQIFKRRVIRKPNCPACRSLMIRQKIVFDFVKESIV